MRGGELSALDPTRKAGGGGCCPLQARCEKRGWGGGLPFKARYEKRRRGGAVRRFRPDTKSGEGGGAV